MTYEQKKFLALALVTDQLARYGDIFIDVQERIANLELMKSVLTANLVPIPEDMLDRVVALYNKGGPSDPQQG